MDILESYDNHITFPANCENPRGRAIEVFFVGKSSNWRDLPARQVGLPGYSYHFIAPKIHGVYHHFPQLGASINKNTRIARWFRMEYLKTKWMIWGIPHFRRHPIKLQNIAIYHIEGPAVIFMYQTPTILDKLTISSYIPISKIPNLLTIGIKLIVDIKFSAYIPQSENRTSPRDTIALRYFGSPGSPTWSTILTGTSLLPIPRLSPSPGMKPKYFWKSRAWVLIHCRLIFGVDHFSV